MSIRLCAIAVLAATSILAGCSADGLAGHGAAGDNLPKRGRAVIGRGAVRLGRRGAVGLGRRAPTPTAGQTSSAAPRRTSAKARQPHLDAEEGTPGTKGVTVEYEITWTSPDERRPEFLVYGVTKCLREAKKNDGKPCLVRGMPSPGQP